MKPACPWYSSTFAPTLATRTARRRGLLPRSIWTWGLGLALAGAYAPAALALDPFVDASERLENPNVTSGVDMGAWDMNNDGLDDIIRLQAARRLEIEYQQPDGTFVRYAFGSVQGYSWGMAIGDINNDGYGDIFTGGRYDGLKVLMAVNEGTEYVLDSLAGPSVFVQCSNFVDINNDGDLDLFVCHDDGLSVPFRGDGTGALVYDPTLIQAEAANDLGEVINGMGVLVEHPDAGNYGTVWTDYDNDGDIDLFLARCRQGEGDPGVGTRINQLFQNDGKGNFIDVGEAAGVNSGAQSWTADLGDIDNDGDLDLFVTNHDYGPPENRVDATNILYRNEGPDNLGVFVDITADSGVAEELRILDGGIQAIFEDFDNDGFIDLLVTAYATPHQLFMNQGDGTFAPADSPFPTQGRRIQSATVGDFNNDGFVDVLAGFARGFNDPHDRPDQLLLNPGNDNHWINVRLTGVASNRSAAGARVELTAGGVTQIREVRAGQGYGITVSPTRHFGLGSQDAIEQIVIRWPSGAVDTVTSPGVDQTIHVVEGCPETFYADVDGDGFGDAAVTKGGCIPEAGYVADDTDCDDGDPNNFPGNAEVCDGVDNNCNGEADEAPAQCDVGESSGSSSGGTGTDTTGDGSTTGPAIPGTTTEDESASSSDSTGAPVDGGAGGCACEVSAPANHAALGLGLLGLPLVMRRRRRSAH